VFRVRSVCECVQGPHYTVTSVVLSRVWLGHAVFVMDWPLSYGVVFVPSE